MDMLPIQIACDSNIWFVRF